MAGLYVPSKQRRILDGWTNACTHACTHEGTNKRVHMRVHQHLCASQHSLEPHTMWCDHHAGGQQDAGVVDQEHDCGSDLGLPLHIFKL